VIETENLSVPHPRAHERLFVLLPWQEIDPDAEIVGRGKVSDLIARLK
jgi:7,8-dihydro-6-hydroxymethylpterin-pyrophosphokinase